MIYIILTIALILFAAQVNVVTGLTGAFLLGILADLVHGNMLGISSLAFLIVVFILSLYRRKLTITSMFFLIPYSIVAILIVHMVQGSHVPSIARLLTRVRVSIVPLLLLWFTMRLWLLLFQKKGKHA